jgi:hypothetical protein
LIEAFRLRRSPDEFRTWHNEKTNARRDASAFEHGSCGPKIGKPSVGAAAYENNINLRTCNWLAWRKAHIS